MRNFSLADYGAEAVSFGNLVGTAENTPEMKGSRYGGYVAKTCRFNCRFGGGEINRFRRKYGGPEHDSETMTFMNSFSDTQIIVFCHVESGTEDNTFGRTFGIAEIIVFGCSFRTCGNCN